MQMRWKMYIKKKTERMKKMEERVSNFYQNIKSKERKFHETRI
jgi:hypothetical protein